MVLSIAILIPAAGASARMKGSDKLAEDVKGERALPRAIRQATATGSAVYVTLPADGPFAQSRLSYCAGHGAHILPIRNWAEGLAASLRAGANAVGPCDGMMIYLPDMPDIDTADLHNLIGVFALDPGRVVRAASMQGAPGHPVILPYRLLAGIGALSGDVGARDLFENESVSLCPIPGNRALLDLDTAEEWRAWRAQDKGRV